MVITATAPCDLVFATSDAWLSGVIRWATRDPGEPSTVSHVGMVVSGASTLANTIVAEAVHRVRIVRIGDAYNQLDDTLQVWRPINIPSPDADRIVATAISRYGRRYPYLKLLLHLIDEAIGRMTGRVPMFLRRIDLTHSYVCSGEVGLWYASCGYDFGAEHRALTPDDMHDFCRAHPDKWTLVPIT